MQQEHNKDGTLNFILIETPLEKLLEVAEKIKLKLPIAENNLEKEGDFQSAISSLFNKIECLNPSKIHHEKPRQYFTAAYNSSIRKEFSIKFLKSEIYFLSKSFIFRFEKYFDSDENNVISAKDRCLITYEILTRTSFSKKLSQPTIFACNENDPHIGIDLLVANETFHAAYPLHEVINLKIKILKSFSKSI